VINEGMEGVDSHQMSLRGADQREHIIHEGEQII